MCKLKKSIFNKKKIKHTDEAAKRAFQSATVVSLCSSGEGGGSNDGEGANGGKPVMAAATVVNGRSIQFNRDKGQAAGCKSAAAVVMMIMMVVG